eukprot:TRINITY_DN479_c0_g1_i1.p1 TRINITY_DN479_c0_g1~~TRINITY_DN479_c0_g1_i1.p1  ORF type:complete len:483 (+),score=91.68 TRINITY_DN479_c0_g1_i1:3-1451(+)
MENLDQQIKSFVEKNWEESVLPSLKDFIRIPNITPTLDSTWETNGNAEKAVKLVYDWVEKQNLKGAKMEILKEPGKPHTIFIEIDAQGGNTKNVMLYAHMDKMPPSEGEWDEGLSPYEPVIKDGLMYGRGCADDGYGVYACILPIKACQEMGIPHPRCVIVFESAEESASLHLTYYIEKLKDRIKTPDLIVCLDSGAGDYDHLWITSTLRGCMNIGMKVSLMEKGVHSGDGSGVVPDSFRICRVLLDRLEDPKTGVVIDEFQSPLSEKREKQLRESAKILGKTLVEDMPLLEGCKPFHPDVTEMVINKSWKAMLCITGAESLPNLENAGNVLRPTTTLKMSMRLPPPLNPYKAMEKAKEILSKDVPHNAKVEFIGNFCAPGLECPMLSPELEKSLDDSAKTFMGHPALYMGEGGSIPFMAMLHEMYPSTQIIVTGILGPGNNAHGPNEMLNIDYTKKLMMCITKVFADYKQANKLAYSLNHS